jgi:hypothetical protein
VEIVVTSNANEVQAAIDIAQKALKDVRVPEIYFAGKVLTSCLYLLGQSPITGHFPD